VTRLQATVALLQAWLDYFPWPETWTGELQRRATTSGPAPFRREVCPDCQGRMKTRAGWMCSTCKGQGTLWRDAYTLDRVERFEPVESPERFRESFRELLQRFVNCSTCGGWGRLSADSNARPTNDHPICDGCFGTGRVPAPFTGVFRAEEESTLKVLSGDRTVDALDRGHEKRDDLDIYRDHLLPALHTLKGLDRYGHFLVEWVWIMGAQAPESLPSERVVRLVYATLAIESVLPDPLKVPGEIRAQHAHRAASLVRAKGKGADKFAQRARDEEIRRLHRGGASLDELAAKYGLDKSRVSRITRAT
jgi:hypothetical protein